MRRTAIVLSVGEGSSMQNLASLARLALVSGARSLPGAMHDVAFRLAPQPLSRDPPFAIRSNTSSEKHETRAKGASMFKVEEANKRMLEWSSVLIVMLLLLIPAGSFAKTPDGAPPSEETVCSGLQGAAFGICNAYCEAQDCDVHPRPSCARLLANFRRITGMPSFPCDTICGDGTIGPGEDCDPPGSVCANQVTCTPDCTCPEPVCGDGVIDPGEECDPGSPLSFCDCLDNCRCATTEPGCCECGDNGCTESVGTDCPAGCTLAPPGTACSDFEGACLVRDPVCCACEGPNGPSCFQGINAAECSFNGCAASSPGSVCSDNGSCVGFSPAP